LDILLCRLKYYQPTKIETTAINGAVVDIGRGLIFCGGIDQFW
jgi:hypothetical protein